MYIRVFILDSHDIGENGRCWTLWNWKNIFGQTVKPLLDSAGFPSKQQNLQMFFSSC